MSSIRNIVFDFGNVLFDLDLSAIGREIQRLVGDQYETVRERLQRSGVFELYETGGLTTEEFVDAIRLAGPAPLSAEQVTAAWNSIFIGMPRERFDMLLCLRQQYNVFLLSNINDLHATWIDDYMLREHGITDFQSRYFDGVYYSHLIRLRKPDREIYEYVLADAEILPQETLFIDDLEENVKAAREVGIQGVVKRAEVDVLALMDSLVLKM
jgi:FMN phosphatase YigB (HAD superfamily)